MTDKSGKKAAGVVIKTLERHNFCARFVGGCVRDELLGVSPKDYDVATNARPEEIERVFAGFHVVPVGREFGTILVVVDGTPVEVTTLRTDVETDGRRATVEFVDSFQEDAPRRDFTINAMYASLNGEVFDFFDGQRHLSECRLVFVGDARERVKEDHLRILRAFRFQARYALTIDDSTLTVLQQERLSLRQISIERVTAEWLGIIEVPQIENTLKIMEDAGILKELFGSWSAEWNFELAAFADAPAGWLSRFRLGILSGYVDLTDRLRLAKWQIRDSVMIGRMLNDIPDGDTSARLQQWGCWRQAWAKYDSEWWSVVDAQVSQFFSSTDAHHLSEAWDRLGRDVRLYAGRLDAHYPVNGRVLKGWGVVQGAELGVILKHLRREFLNGHWQTKDEARLIVNQWLTCQKS